MPHKILVADDDLDNRTIAQDVLEAAGYEIVMAVDGQEALDKIAAEKPDAVLLDLAMPKVTGWEVVRRIRKNHDCDQMPIIAYTAHALFGEELKAKAAGCNDYLPKPCMPKAIVERVALWIGRSRSPSRGAA